MYDEQRAEILKTARKMIDLGLIKLGGGNFSVRAGDHVVLTPSGKDYLEMDESDLMVVDMNGNVVEGKHKPSLDTPGLLYIYNHMPDVHALIHTHQVYATAISLVTDRLPAILLTLANAVGGEVLVTPFAPAGKVETGVVTVDTIGDKKAVILKQHGVMAAAKNLKEAMYAAVYLEEAAKSWFAAKSVADPAVLNDDQIREAVNIFVNYGD